MRKILVILMICAPMTIVAQTLTVSEFYLDTKDLTAINEETKVVDDNNEVCALLRVETTQKGFFFEGGTIGIAKVDDNHPSEVWVYVPAGLRRISIMHNKLGILRNYEFPELLQAGRTYVMKLITGSVETVVKQKPTSQWFVLDFEPKEAMVEIDGVIVEGTDGKISKNLAHGKHDVRVSAVNYHTEVIKVEIGAEKKVMSVVLKPAYGWIEVKSPEGASVYVDNQKVGEAPMKTSPIPSGQHDLRVTKDKWLPFREQVFVSDNKVVAVTPQLIANFVSVKLQTGGNAEIWVNGVKEGNGSVTIDLTPGEYSFESRKEKHRTQSIVCNITMSTEGTIDIPSPVAIVGVLSVDVKPIGAKIYLDEEYKGESPLMLEDILIGEHKVKTTYSGLGDEVKDVVVAEGKISEISIEMKTSPEDIYNEGKRYYEAGDYTKAVEYIRRAAEMGYAKAQCGLGVCYSNGDGVERDHSTAVEWYKKAAEQGYAGAQCYIGECYYDGEGVEQNYITAVKWYRKAAEQGFARAQDHLGNCYYNGEGVEQNYNEAVKWYRKAAEQGNSSAQNMLGVCYADGEGIEQNYNEAVKWFRKAAEQGNSIAQNNLGICYYNGEGIEQNDYEAVKWYRKSAEQGYDWGQCNIGRCYYFGRGVEQNYNEAVKWYRKAAEQGNSSAQTNLGFCYDCGFGVEQNYNEAVKWYRKAAEQGNDCAQNNLGVCYENGLGIEQNYNEAVKWYRKSAEQGNSNAQHNLENTMVKELNKTTTKQ